MLRKPLVVAISAVLLAVATVSAARAQEVVFVVRHAERLDDSSDSPLSPEGRARAVRLAQTLREAGISAIYVSQFQRTAKTAQPLADLVKAPLDTTTAADTAALVAKVRSLGPSKRALIVSHSDRLPGVLAALGVRQEVTIPGNQYDDLFVVVYHGPDAAPTFLRLKY